MNKKWLLLIVLLNFILISSPIFGEIVFGTDTNIIDGGNDFFPQSSWISVFEDDFELGFLYPENWTVVDSKNQGEWVVADHQSSYWLQHLYEGADPGQTSDNRIYTTNSITIGDDFRISYLVKPLVYANLTFGSSINTTDGKWFSLAEFSVETDEVIVGLSNNPTTEPYDFEIDTCYEIDVEYLSETVTVWVNSTEVLSTSVSSLPTETRLAFLSEGYEGRNARMVYDNVLVETLYASGYTITVSTPSVYYDDLIQIIDITGVTATCSNPAHGALEGNEATQHTYTVYTSGGSVTTVSGDLFWDSYSDEWQEFGIDVSSLSPGNYYVKCTFEDNDAPPATSSPSSEFTITSSPPPDDLDGDGLSDDQEATYGTDPLDSDSDDDGLTDGKEVRIYNTDPLDSDSDDDGLTDGAEVNSYGTNPKKSDSDGDGLSDSEEVNTYQTDLKDTDTDDDGYSDRFEIDSSWDPKDDQDPPESSVDTDADGVSDAEEGYLGTNPLDADSDDDGLTDGEEVSKHGCKPLDADSDDDGLTDGEEVQTYRSDPTDADSDDDGLTDDQEVNTYQADPTDDDTDDDSLPDQFEIDNDLDPLDEDDAGEDADDDSLTNLEEYELGTDCNNDDSDDDQMLDGWENDNDLDPLLDDAANDTDADGLTNLLEFQLETDPNDDDSDNDGMTDGWEYEKGLNPTVNDATLDPDKDDLTNAEEYMNGTDPLNRDTDADGHTDGAEIAAGKDPLDPKDHPFSWELWMTIVTIVAGVLGGLSAAIGIFKQLRKDNKDKPAEDKKEEQKATKMTEVADDSLLEEREEALRKIFQRYTVISLEEMAQILQFKDRCALQQWLLTLPDDLTFHVERDEVIIQNGLQNDSEEAGVVIDSLMESFGELEREEEAEEEEEEP